MTVQPTTQLHRPAPIVAIVVLRAIDGLFGLLTASLLLLSDLGQGAIEMAGGMILPPVIPLVILTLSLLELLSAVGLWMLRRWARLLAIMMSPPFLVLSAFGIFASGGRDPGTYLGVGVGLATLYWLLQPRLKALFT